MDELMLNYCMQIKELTEKRKEENKQLKQVLEILMTAENNLHNAVVVLEKML